MNSPIRLEGLVTVLLAVTGPCAPRPAAVPSQTALEGQRRHSSNVFVLFCSFCSFPRGCLHRRNPSNRSTPSGADAGPPAVRTLTRPLILPDGTRTATGEALRCRRFPGCDLCRGPDAAGKGLKCSSDRPARDKPCCRKSLGRVTLIRCTQWKLDWRLNFRLICGQRLLLSSRCPGGLIVSPCSGRCTHSSAAGEETCGWRT